uniref:Potassium transporter n=1 Tax=Hordeum vulgare subsp. vulgare TaxID=112509 RepID=A0A8I6X9P3_HORVV
MSLQVEDPRSAETPAPLKRHDSLFGDAEKVSDSKHHGSQVSWMRTLSLAFQSVGIIYGDIGTSPLYVYSSTFPDGIRNRDDLLGVLSLILYTLIIIPMLKYVFIVLYANDNGDGGTFALYSLISRYAKIRLIPDQQAEDAAVSNYHIEAPNSQLKRAQWLKQKLESSKAAKIVLFTLTILGTSMVIGDGTLTPAISVLSAVSGIREKAPSLTQTQVVLISVAILFMLFSVQRFGTDKVGYTFAPVISVWFLLIAGIGMYNLVVHDIGVLRAFNPMYIVQYFIRNGKSGWVSLGGIILCVTGTEGMFADLGHFNIRAVQLSFNGILFPSVALCYIGQAAYLRKFPDNVANTFYRSIPAPMFWPTFIVAILAAIIASQAMLSGAFAILSKALSLGCMPRVRVIHTSHKYEGQVYIPEVNFLMGLASIVVTVAFRTTTSIGHAYGICVVTTFAITTHLMTVVMLLIWKKHVMFIMLFYVVFGSIELIYLSSIMSKFIFRQVGPREHRMFRCVARYGYSDTLEEPKEFAAFLVDRLKMFIQEESAFALVQDQEESGGAGDVSDALARPRRSTVHSEEAVQGQARVSSHSASGRMSFHTSLAVEEEKQLIDREVERGMVYLMGEANVTAEAKSSILKKIVVNHVYTFLRKNLTEGHKVLAIPKDQLLKVGITYEI